MASRSAAALAILVILASCSVKEDDADAGGGGSETSADACADAIDNDGDGRTDCDDIACTVHPWCEPAGIDSGGGRPDTGPIPVDTPPRVDAGPIPPACSDPIDVAFVLDVSTSMADDVAAIRDGLTSIWNATTALTSGARFGMVVFVDDALAVNGCASFATLEEMQAEFETWRAFCSTNRSPTSSMRNTDCAENSLDALYAAATVCPWRADATHIVIHVTDDTFAERPAVLSRDPLFGTGGIPVQHTYGEVVDALVANLVRVGAFASPSPGEPCGPGLSGSPTAGAGFHTPYLAMPSLVDATGGRVWNIRDARTGMLDMAEAINEFTEDEHCTLF